MWTQQRPLYTIESRRFAAGNPIPSRGSRFGHARLVVVLVADFGAVGGANVRDRHAAMTCTPVGRAPRARLLGLRVVGPAFAAGTGRMTQEGVDPIATQTSRQALRLGGPWFQPCCQLQHRLRLRLQTSLGTINQRQCSKRETGVISMSTSKPARRTRRRGVCCDDTYRKRERRRGQPRKHGSVKEKCFVLQQFQQVSKRQCHPAHFECSEHPGVTLTKAEQRGRVPLWRRGSLPFELVACSCSLRYCAERCLRSLCFQPAPVENRDTPAVLGLHLPRLCTSQR